MLTIKGLTKEVVLPEGKSLKILDVPELKIEQGTQMVICGASGSGKTTLLNIIAGFLLPTSGEIWNDELQLDKLTSRQHDKWRAENTGYIFQRLNLLDYLTVEENLAAVSVFSRKLSKAETKDRIAGMLEQVGLADKRNLRPQKLSVGEQQRVAIARAVLNSPRLILADEPTASLDRENSLNVLEILRRVCDEVGGTLLISTHDEMIKQEFSRHYNVRDRRLEE